MISSHNRKRFFSSAVVIILFFSALFYSEAGDFKEELTAYIKALSPIMTDVDITIRNTGSGLLPMREGVKKINAHISQIKSLNHPESLNRQHKMILLSFRKMRMGLLVFSPDTRNVAIGLIRDGGRLLRYAANDIVAIAKNEGIIKKEDSQHEQGQQKKGEQYK